MSARPTVVVRDRPVGRSAHGRRYRRRSRRRRGLDRPQVPASAQRPVPGRRVGQPATTGVLRVPADRLGPDALPAARLGPADDGRPLLGHQFHGRRPHVPAQVRESIDRRHRTFAASTARTSVFAVLCFSAISYFATCYGLVRSVHSVPKILDRSDFDMTSVIMVWTDRSETGRLIVSGPNLVKVSNTHIKIVF